MLRQLISLAIANGLLTLWVGLLPAQSVDAESQQDKQLSNPPRSLEEGLQRMEEIFGRYMRETQHEWQFPINDEVRSRETPDSPEILMLMKGGSVTGLPFMHADKIAFDQVMSWNREVYDLDEDGQRTLIRTQATHHVERFSIRPTDDGVWLIFGHVLSNGVHSAIGGQSFQGTVRWLDNGVEFVGLWMVDRFNVAGGEMVTGIGHGSQRFTRDGDRLERTLKMQAYYLAKDPEGNVIPIPDFSRPLGSLITLQSRSEPRMAPVSK